MTKRILCMVGLLALLQPTVEGQTIDEVFANPPQEARPLMIWQWMDGVVSAEGITADLEAYKAAGIGGVQQFQVGGPMQGVICDTANAIGTANWQRLMHHAISECERLGLSFGTHNCPGWSSSAFPTVTPEYSMQKLVWTDTIVAGGSYRPAALRQPAVDPQYNYYRDIAVLAFPADSIVQSADVIDLTGKEECTLPRHRQWHLLRIGHTTNGKTNEATAPLGGRGLECDKMSREAVRRYWQSYPQMVLSLVGKAAGKTFQRIEIDSYEAGGQEWSTVLPDEFRRRCGYDIVAWLPVLTGQTIGSADRSRQFRNDYAKVGQQLFAENYYGYMAELAHEHGLRLLYQPYGTNSSKPFNPISTEAIARLLPDDYFCTEFWTNPSNWGWPQLPRHMQTAHKLGLRRIFAEGFTHWPIGAWQEDPASQKVLADKAFCLGVNALMLHAGAQNPWPGAVPGMTFGKWGSWWTPGQTWWRSGGAQLLFAYMARCQALLQRGQWVDDYTSKTPSLRQQTKLLQWVHRRDDDADIYFLSNPADSAFYTTVTIADNRQPEVWLPETGDKLTRLHFQLKADGSAIDIPLHFDEHQSLFIVLRARGGQQPEEQQAGKATGSAWATDWQTDEKTRVYTYQYINIAGPWTLSFPEGWGAPENIVLDSLMPWNEHHEEGVRYFSGTATYEKTLRLKRLDRDARYVLELGTVKNLAQVSVNGLPVAHLWKKPFRCDITPYLKKGRNVLHIAVTNLWPNRMIGDELWEDDVEWDQSFSYDYAPGKPSVGCFMKRVPQWLKLGLPRPSAHRRTVVSFKYFTKDSPLLPSGLLGPVVLKVEKQKK